MAQNNNTSGSNNLFPLFLKLENFRLLIIGGGNIALEKLNAVLQNSPATSIQLISLSISDAIQELAKQHPTISLQQKAYHISDLDTVDVVIAAVNDIPTSEQISKDCRQKNKLVNVADKPELCDFYLSSVVKKGHIKIAISTNGKSPTIAKRLKQVIDEMIPDEMEDVLENIQTIRQGMTGDFNEKVKQLNDLTKVLVAKQTSLKTPEKPEEKKWTKIVLWCLLAFACLIIGYGLSSYVSFNEITTEFKTIPQHTINAFLIMLLTGFIAQMVDGSLGMGYGTISTTFLLATGVAPAIVSSRVHSARVFSSGVSGYSHHRFGNINKKLFMALVIPGIVGAIIGAGLASLVSMGYFGSKLSTYVRVPLSIYTIYLGYYIMRKAFSKKTTIDKVKGAGWLATVGGFMDAFAGGGWGTLVTSTLMAKRKSPRYVIGSVCLAEFFVVLCSSITFFILVKISLWDVAGLIVGGLIAAPIAARLVGKLPLKTMFILVGLLVILTSTNTLWKAVQVVIH
jgi:siroheme synthase-like protein